MPPSLPTLGLFARRESMLREQAASLPSSGLHRIYAGDVRDHAALARERHADRGRLEGGIEVTLRLAGEPRPPVDADVVHREQVADRRRHARATLCLAVAAHHAQAGHAPAVQRDVVVPEVVGEDQHDVRRATLLLFGTQRRDQQDEQQRHGVEHHVEGGQGRGCRDGFAERRIQDVQVLLAKPRFSTRGILTQMDVRVLTLPDGLDPADFLLRESAEAMLKLANVQKSDVVYDLGSGDGRLPILAAQLHGARGVGIEIDPRLVAISRSNAKDAGVLVIGVLLGFTVPALTRGTQDVSTAERFEHLWRPVSAGVVIPFRKTLSGSATSGVASTS